MIPGILFISSPSSFSSHEEGAGTFIVRFFRTYAILLRRRVNSLFLWAALFL